MTAFKKIITLTPCDWCVYITFKIMTKCMYCSINSLLEINFVIWKILLQIQNINIRPYDSNIKCYSSPIDTSANLFCNSDCKCLILHLLLSITEEKIFCSSVLFNCFQGLINSTGFYQLT